MLKLRRKMSVMHSLWNVTRICDLNSILMFPVKKLIICVYSSITRFKIKIALNAGKYEINPRFKQFFPNLYCPVLKRRVKKRQLLPQPDFAN
jgi:hypothetical protein